MTSKVLRNDRVASRTILAVTTFALLAVVAPGDSLAQAFRWAKPVGGTLDDFGYAIAVDGSGNVYTTGSFRGTVDFDPGPGTHNLTSMGQVELGGDVFVSKLDSAGNFVWAKQIGGAFDDNPWFIAVDGSGNVYTTGYFQGTADFDPGAGTSNLTSMGEGDVFVSKLNSAGNFVWARRVGGPFDDAGFAVAVDGSGNVYTSGSFQDTVDFDPGLGTSNLTSAGDADVFVVKLNSAGIFVWAKQMGGALADSATAIALDGSGNVYTTGYFQDTTDFDPGPGTYDLTSFAAPPYSNNVFISKLDSAGNFVWAKQMGGAADAAGYFIAVDGVGNAYTTGYFQGSADFDPGLGTYNLASVGEGDVFVSKLDSVGNFDWAKRMGGPLDESAIGIAVDGGGNVYTTGYFKGNADFDPGPAAYNLTSAGFDDVFISKLDTSGAFVWARRMGGPLDDVGYIIAVDGFGNIHTTGSFQGTADFDPGPGNSNLTSAGGADVFVSKLEQLPRLGFTDKNTIAWSPLFGEAEYNIYRSSSGRPGTFACFMSHEPDQSATDLATPSPGFLYAYLVTSVNAAGVEGSMGFAAVNGTPTTERPNTSACP